MGETTHISWADHTFNPWIGCMKVGPACDGCYAEAQQGDAGRYGRVIWGRPGVGVGTRSRTAPSNWKQPLAWERKAIKDGTRPFVFCASLADVFDNAVDPQWRRDLFDLIRATPHLTWLLLTKRPQMIRKLWLDVIRAQHIEQLGGEAPPDSWLLHNYPFPMNAAIGCTVVTQEEADRDIPHLLVAAAELKPAFTFVSIEPMLEAMDLTRLSTMRFRGAEVLNALTGELSGMFGEPAGVMRRIDWVICGGETDQGKHKARPANPAWFRGLRDQCADSGTPFHLKQNGEFIGASILEPDLMVRVGKKGAGRLLDGVVHDARPEVPA